MGYFEYKGIEFYYRSSGKGIPFIFLHGMGGSTKQSAKLFAPPKGIRMIYMDLRGNGNTDIGKLETLRFVEMAKDVEALATHLKLKHFLLGGISMGAAVAIRFAIEYTSWLRGLVLIRPAWTHFPMDAENRELYHRIADLIEEFPDPKQAAKEYKKDAKYRELKREAPQVAQSLLGHFSEQSIKKTHEKFRILPDQSPFHNPGQLKQIGCPTLIVASKQDPIHKYQYGVYHRDYILDSKLVEIIPKSRDIKLHREEIQIQIESFIQSVFEKESLPKR